MKTKLKLIGLALAVSVLAVSCEKEPRVTISVEASPNQWNAIFKKEGIPAPSP